VKGVALQQETGTKKRLRRTWWFWVVIAFVVIVVLGGGAVLADWIVYYGEIHAGVTVNGVYLRGKTVEQATVALQELVQNAGGPVTINGGGKTWTVTPEDVGRVIDVQAAVTEAKALTNKGNFFQDVVARFDLYRHARDISLHGSVDKAKLDALTARVATDLHVTPLNAQLKMENGAVKVSAEVPGRDVNTAALGAELESRFVTLHTGAVEIPLVVTTAAVKTSDNAAAQQQAELMMSAPITLINHDKQWTISQQQIASWLDFQTDYSSGVPEKVPYLSEGAIWNFLNGLIAEVNRDPVNAGLNSPDGVTLKVIPGVNGEALDVSATAKALMAAAGKGTGRSVAAVLSILEPDLTTAEVQAETFTTQLSTFTTKYACPANRAQNVRITTKYATNVLLAPGQEYNFDKQIGPRTAARGYKLAPGIVGPNTLEDVLGGGICQVSTTMFNAAFFAGLKVTERHNHSIYISHYPKGRDATVTGGGKNLRFVNDTGHYIWIKGTSNGTTTTISIFGTSDGRKVAYTVGNFYGVKSPTSIKVSDPTLAVGKTRVIDSGQTGRKLKTTRTVTLPNGKVIHNDVWISVWPMYPAQIAVGTKPVTP
jgi:vancomycin resistance protein YoaR